MEALTPSPSTAVPAPPAAGAPSDVSVPLPDAAAPPPAPTVASAPSGRKRLTTALVWGLCLFAALVDETIQIFSGRGSQIPDVWLDGAGALSGLALSLGLSSLKKWISKRRI